MKKGLLIIFTMALSTLSLADKYESPDIVFERHPAPNSGSVEKVDWESNYKVEEAMDKDRNIASEEEEYYEPDSLSREPSSFNSKKLVPTPKKWKYNPDRERE